MDLRGAFERIRSRFGKPDVADLARLHEPRHRADRLLDRHVGVDAVQVVEVDGLDAELREARVAGRAHVLGPAVVGLGAVRVVDIAELGADHDAVAAALQRAAEHALVPALHVAVGGVEERDAQVHRAVHGRYLHLVVALAEIRGGAARAQADGGNRRAVFSELAVFHGWPRRTATRAFTARSSTLSRCRSAPGSFRSDAASTSTYRARSMRWRPREDN